MSEINGPVDSNAQKNIDTGLTCLTLLLRFLGVAADPTQIKREFAAPGKFLTQMEILRAAKHFGLKAKVVTTTWAKILKTPLPAIAQDYNGFYFILAKVADDKVLIQDSLEKKPLVLSKREFENAWNGKLILLTKRAFKFSTERHFDLSWFIPVILKYKRLLAEVLTASFFMQLLTLISPLFFQVVIDKVLVHHSMTTLDVLVFGLVIVTIFDVILTGLRNYIFSHTTNRVDVELGAGLFRHMLSLPLSYFQVRRVGDSIARIRELENIRSFLTGSALTLVIDLFFTIVFLAVMYYYSPTLTLIVILAIPFYVGLSLLVTPVFRRRLDEKFARGAENQAFLVESVTGVETLKAMAVEPQMQRRWEEQLAAYVSAAFRVSNLGNVSSQTAQLINKVVSILTLWFGAKLVIEGHITVGQLVAFNMLSGNVSGPVLRLAQMWQDFQQVRVSVKRLGDILNTHGESTQRADRASLPAVTGQIVFEHVIFRYVPGGAEILSDVSLNIKPGQIVGIVGPSGSGKSTLTKLVQRLFIPERGRVLIDGVDLAMVDPAWLRRQVGVVLQENILFNATIRNNIALIDPSMPMERVVTAAKLAGAHEFILELPEGYDTMVGERGMGLSGGQRQRIAIARALVVNPKILIFDEATSALDYESERIIQDNMKMICKGRTVLIIAHRLSTVRQTDRIITIEKGRIVEDGSHESLLQLNGRYAKLYHYQTTR
ncbi:MAG: type I secretion system permease/ATPase [Alphaproteobacteria bacterium]|nr:type I secretion system permease/ATPase [Alphaproteobacteria bacterium]